MRSWSGSCRRYVADLCIVNREPLAFRNSLKLTADVIAKSTPYVSSTSPMACRLCRSHLISAPRCARRSPQHRPFSNRHYNSRIYAKQTATGSGSYSAQKPVITDDDLIPSDAEVVPLEGIYQSGDKQKLKGKTALVAGATGGVGGQIVRTLQASGVKVRALVRDYTKANSDLYMDGVDVIKGDVYQYSTLPAAMQKCDFVLCATGSTDRLNPFGPFTVDYQGTLNLVAAAKQAKVKKFVLVTSIGTDDPLFPLNLFFGVLFWKKRAEEELQRSGLEYTIVRPGGLLNEPRDNQREGGVVMAGPDTFGLPPRRTPGSILRRQVAEICVDALSEPAAANKVVEIIAEQSEFGRPSSELFASVQ